MDGVLGRSHANAATSIEAHQPNSLSQHGPVLGEQATAKRHNGWIEARNNPNGKGAIVTLRLPLKPGSS
jgi:hypothetical protein